jgi:hypothetical protein
MISKNFNYKLMFSFYVLQNVISMTDQLKLFAEYKEKLKAIAGEKKAAKILSEAFYVICVGTDDIANTYFTSPFRVVEYDIPSYVNLLISHASSFIKVYITMQPRSRENKLLLLVYTEQTQYKSTYDKKDTLFCWPYFIIFLCSIFIKTLL